MASKVIWCWTLNQIPFMSLEMLFSMSIFSLMLYLLILPLHILTLLFFLITLHLKLLLPFFSPFLKIIPLNPYLLPLIHNLFLHTPFLFLMLHNMFYPLLTLLVFLILLFLLHYQPLLNYLF